MKALVIKYMESIATNPAIRFFCGDRRKQKNLERIVANQSMTYATMHGVITDHRVAESMIKVDELACSMILTLEVKLGRKLSRERAQALVAAFNRIRTARLSKSDVVVSLGLLDGSSAPTQHIYH